jgi:glycine hydroxymethyltransferase
MIAAENVMGKKTRKLLDSDLATRLTEGFPGAKYFPPPQHNRFIDEIEAIIIALAKQLFRAQYVEWRPLNSTMANAVVLFALTVPGDVIMVQSMGGGGNMSYHPVAIPGLRGLVVKDLPPTEDFRIDFPALRGMVDEINPKLFVVGGGRIILPFQLNKLRDIADEIGAKILYDGAHLGPLLATGIFQDPLAEGADVVTVSTHKMLGGPVGGLILTNDEALAKKFLHLTFPAFIQTRDLNKYAACAHALAEVAAFGEAYAKQVVANAQALAKALAAEGFQVLGKKDGYTYTHQVILDVRDLDAAQVEAKCQVCNILIHKAELLGDDQRGYRTGMRLTVQELTRKGMREAEMTEIAQFIRKAAIDNEDPLKLAGDVETFVKKFQTVHYSFDEA